MSLFQCIRCLNLSEAIKLSEQSSDTLSKNFTQKVSETVNSINLNKQETIRQETQQSKDEDENAIFIKCLKCDQNFCKKCYIIHHKQGQKQSASQTKDNQQFPLAVVICQECQEQDSLKFCESCQQFLCQQCCLKIHKKGKRAKHKLELNSKYFLEKTKSILFNKQFCEVLKNKNQNYQEGLLIILTKEMQLNEKQTLIILQKSLYECLQIKENKIGLYEVEIFQKTSLNLENLPLRYPLMECIQIMIVNKETENYNDLQKGKLNVSFCETYTSSFHQSQKLNVENCKTKHIPTFSNLSVISKIQSKSIFSYLDSSNILSEVENTTLNNSGGDILLKENASDSDINEQLKRTETYTKLSQTKKVQKASHHRYYSTRQQLLYLNINNFSTSTENSIKKRHKKSPIPFLQSYRVHKSQRNTINYQTEIYLRQLAETGILMVNRQKAQKFLIESDISRKFVRSIGEKQIEYVSYNIDFISVECLCWVIESIKEDKMTPNQKLIISRIKQSFDLKINMKLWQSVLKYLSSPQYQQDYYQYGFNQLPKIEVVRVNEQHLLEFENKKWQYQDQAFLDEDEDQWKMFKEMLSSFFKNNNQITGGRYGCVQYAKLNGCKLLRKCSLGKLSMFVQQAINKGIIRYNKTLIVSNNDNNVSNNSMSIHSELGLNTEENTHMNELILLQKNIKIMLIQKSLVDILLEVGPNTSLSLAQMPLNLKRTIMFQINLVDLGFPKLKNMLATIQDQINIETSKTNILYYNQSRQNIEKHRHHLQQQRSLLLSHIISHINHIINHYKSLTLSQLYTQINMSIGFIFEFRVFYADFYHFIVYCCNHILTSQVVNGEFVVYQKYMTFGQIPEYESNSKAFQNLYNINVKNPSVQNEFAISFQNKSCSSSQKTPTPKFNNKNQFDFDNCNWSCFESDSKKDHKIQDNFEEIYSEKQSKSIQQYVVNNILDDENISDNKSKPGTVIENQGSNFLKEGLLVVNLVTINEKDSIDDSGDYFEINNEEQSKKKKLMQSTHLRVKTGNIEQSKHQRISSSIISQKQM